MTAGTAGQASADPLPPASYAFGSNGYVEVHGSCKRPVPVPPQAAASYTHVPLDTFELPAAELTCAQDIFEIMRTEANGGLYDTYNVTGHLLPQLNPWRAVLSDPYQVFLDNMDVSLLILETLSSYELAGCELTEPFLMIVCDDVGQGSVTTVPEFGAFEIPTFGVYSADRAGTTYGNVFMVDHNYTGGEASRALLHHEQVHAQQWSRGGVVFWQQYFNESLQAEYEAALKRSNPAGYPNWYSQDGWCNNLYERQANFENGGYRDHYRPIEGTHDPVEYHFCTQF